MRRRSAVASRRSFRDTFNAPDAGGNSVLSRFVRISGAIVLLSLSSALAQAPSSASGAPISLSAEEAISIRRHAPRKPAGLHPDQVIDNVTVTESNNWGGYAVTGALFTQARGSWVVPAVDCSAVPNSSVSFWWELMDGKTTPSSRLERIPIAMVRRPSITRGTNLFPPAV